MIEFLALLLLICWKLNTSCWLIVSFTCSCEAYVLTAEVYQCQAHDILLMTAVFSRAAQATSYSAEVYYSLDDSNQSAGNEFSSL
ncbi:hypothetical protein [Sphingobacterium puteale]|uniref:hypothetical protein n=1 Tax=Sphingobacterium puteale TaxID=2420510 RepID=UPI0016027499|nr:hypothetical protein [Sphingobacterium puteale]